MQDSAAAAGSTPSEIVGRKVLAVVVSMTLVDTVAYMDLLVVEVEGHIRTEVEAGGRYLVTAAADVELAEAADVELAEAADVELAEAADVELAEAAEAAEPAEPVAPEAVARHKGSSASVAEKPHPVGAARHQKPRSRCAALVVQDLLVAVVQEMEQLARVEIAGEWKSS